MVKSTEVNYGETGVYFGEYVRSACESNKNVFHTQL